MCPIQDFGTHFNESWKGPQNKSTDQKQGIKAGQSDNKCIEVFKMLLISPGKESNQEYVTDESQKGN